MKKIHVVAFEDATSDTFMYIDDAGLGCKLDSKKIYLELLYGDKIPVDRYAHEVGGNAANVAAGIASFGLASAVFGTIGGDSRGKDILSLLRKRNVITTYLKPVPGRSTNISVIITYKGERTILTHHPVRGSNMSKLPEADWYYLSQAQNPSLYATIGKKAAAGSVKLAFNPGSRMIKRDKKSLQTILRHTDIVFVNKEEAEEILGISRKTSVAHIKKLLRALASGSRGLAVITDGPRGAYAFDGETYQYIRPFPADRIEPTGAGDAFASGVLAGVIKGRSLGEALVWGSMNSAQVIRTIGSQVGLLTEKKAVVLCKKHPNYKAKKI